MQIASKLAQWPAYQKWTRFLCFSAVLSLGTLAIAQPTSNASAADSGPAVVPWPKSINAKSGTLTLGRSPTIVLQDATLDPLGPVLTQDLLDVTGLKATVVSDSAKSSDIVLKIDPKLANEDYVLTIGDNVTITGANYNAVAMGTVTFLQVLKTEQGTVVAPKLTIHDGPQMKYTGYMLDVARKPWSIDGLKKYIIWCRFNKIRYFQLHLTDDNAWTFPSKSFPQLGSANYAWAGGEKPVVYDLQELKDLVTWADARGVTLVPEIETLGHSDSLRLAMPDTFDHPDKPGGPAHLAIVNIANDAIYPAFDKLMGDVADVFKSSPYIHIGCDEARYSELEKLPETTAYLKAHNYPDIYHLEAQHIRRMNEIVKKYGKRTIAWEPRLGYGDIPKDLIAMPWVGNNKAADGYLKAGMEFISAPWGTAKPYHDVYEVNGTQVPRGNPLEIGATGLSWQAPESDPFGASMFNEPVYNPNADRGVTDFTRRALIVQPILDKMIYGFAMTTQGQLDPSVLNTIAPIFTQELSLSLVPARAGGKVRYTLNGTPVTPDSRVAAGPIKLHQTTTVRARWFSDDGRENGFEVTREFKKQNTIVHDGVGAKVTIVPDNPGYVNGGAKSLADGYLASEESSGDRCNVGWQASPIITLDLGKPKEIKQISEHFFEAGGGLHLPKSIDIQLSSDGKDFHSVAGATQEEALANHGWFVAKLKAPETAQFVRVVVTAGGEWTFTDEVVVNAPIPGPTLLNAAMGKPVTVATEMAKRDAANPPAAVLTDGYVSPTPDYLNPQWVGFPKGLDATIDLGAKTDITEVGGDFMQHIWGGQRIPNTLTVSVSDDGKNFHEIATITHIRTKNAAELATLSKTVDGVSARYVKFVAPAEGGSVYVGELFVNPTREKE